MNDDTLTDLKQFIAATVSQEASQIHTEVRELDKKLSNKLDDLSDSVAEAISSNNDRTDTKLEDHESRITRIENSAIKL